jgi:DivIVA domain-containing protein
VTNAFNRSGKRKLGYNITQVDEFLQLAREQYADSSKSLLTAEEVRTTRFEVQRNGYSISVVDAALEKLEDVFAANEYGKELLKVGYSDFTDDLADVKSLVLARCSRKNRRKFARRVWPNKGYSTKQVDKLCSQLGKSLESKTELTVKELRTATFKSKRGGYAEYQVDAFLEKVVEALQREQALQKVGL